MIYFDNAATGGKKPENVLSAVSSAIRICANPGRSGHKLSLTTANLVHECRNALSSFFDGYGFDRVIFTKNCTEALNIALFGVLEKGDHVVTTKLEHNSVLRPLEHLKKAGFINYDVCKTANGKLLPEEIASRITQKTKLVIVTTASNVNGEIPPIAEIKKRLPAHVLLLCDGAQGGGHLDISMKKQGIDMLALAGHKGLMGIQGSGALLFSERIEIKPLLFGGTGSMSLSLDMPDFYPDSLEAGTLAFPAILSLLEGIRYLTLHRREIQEKLTYLTDYLIKGLQEKKAIRIYSKPNPCGIVAFSHQKLQSEHVASILSDSYGIAVRGGLHCAPFMHEALGTLDGGLVRVSFSHFNTTTEIEKLLFALKEIKSNTL